MKAQSAAEWLDIESLIPWDANPRLNAAAIAPVVKSIEEFGFASPIVARLKDKRIIAGHTRLEAAKKLGHKTVPVRLLDLTEKQAELLALADNKIGELAQWDEHKLEQVVKSLHEEDFDLMGLGFTEFELGEILNLNHGEIVPSESDLWKKEWKEMPEFVQEDLTPHRSLKVHFKTEKDVADFAALIGQQVTDKTKWVWYPKMEVRTVADKEYTDSEDALGYKLVNGADVPGGHYVLHKEGKSPSVNHMKECASIPLRHSDVVVDIGAYVGTYAIRCARFPVKKVIAYEPTPRSFEVLSKTKLPNLTNIQAAVVGDDSAEIRLHISRGIGTTNSIALSNKKVDSVIVPAVNYVEAVKEATIVKIDIEGAEYSLPIIQPQLRAIIIDFHPVPEIDWISKAKKVVKELKAAGFSTVIKPTISKDAPTWWALYKQLAGSWIREMETSGQHDDLMSGKLCCGCGVEIKATGKALCKSCFGSWSKKHRKGFDCES